MGESNIAGFALRMFNNRNVDIERYQGLSWCWGSLFFAEVIQVVGS